jgi:hypothetical protein
MILFFRYITTETNYVRCTKLSLHSLCMDQLIYAILSDTEIKFIIKNIKNILKKELCYGVCGVTKRYLEEYKVPLISVINFYYIIS